MNILLLSYLIIDGKPALRVFQKSSPSQSGPVQLEIKDVDYDNFDNKPKLSPIKKIVKQLSVVMMGLATLTSDLPSDNTINTHPNAGMPVYEDYSSDEDADLCSIGANYYTSITPDDVTIKGYIPFGAPLHIESTIHTTVNGQRVTWYSINRHLHGIDLPYPVFIEGINAVNCLNVSAVIEGDISQVQTGSSIFGDSVRFRIIPQGINVQDLINGSIDIEQYLPSDLYIRDLGELPKTVYLDQDGQINVTALYATVFSNGYYIWVVGRLSNGDLGVSAIYSNSGDAIALVGNYEYTPPSTTINEPGRVELATGQYYDGTFQITHDGFTAHYTRWTPDDGNEAIVVNTILLGNNPSISDPLVDRADWLSRNLRAGTQIVFNGRTFTATGRKLTIFGNAVAPDTLSNAGFLNESWIIKFSNPDGTSTIALLQ